MLTETLSDIVARQHMRASKCQVIAATNAALEKRSEINIRLIGILAEIKSEVDARIIAERGRNDGSAASAARNQQDSRPIYDDGSAYDIQRYEDNRMSVQMQNLGLGDLGSMMDALLETGLVDDGNGSARRFILEGAHPNHVNRNNDTTQTNLNDGNISEQAMLERAIRESMAEEKRRETTHPSPPLTPLSEFANPEAEELAEEDNAQINLDPFHCKACTFLNEYGNVCAICNTERPSKEEDKGELANNTVSVLPPPPTVTQETENPSQDEGESPQQPPSKGSTWTCEVCTLINIGQVTVCVACETSRVFDKGSKPSGAPSCEVCGKSAEFRCTGCQKTYYCGKECQLKGWKVHRERCLAAQMQAQREGGGEQGEEDNDSRREVDPFAPAPASPAKPKAKPSPIHTHPKYMVFDDSKSDAGTPQKVSREILEPESGKEYAVTEQHVEVNHENEREGSDDDDDDQHRDNLWEEDGLEGGKGLVEEDR